MKKRSQHPIPPKPVARRRSRPPVEGKVQMEDIAQLAGVSRSTVSRALSHSPVVNPETRERIQRLARSLKYSIHVGARNLRLQQNRTVAVVLPFDAKTHQSVSDPFFVSLMGSLADALTARGYDMLVSRVDAERLDLAGDLAASGRAIGVILVGQWHHHDQINELAARQSPIVVWGAHLPQQIYCTIGGDNIAGGMLAMRRARCVGLDGNPRQHADHHGLLGADAEELADRHARALASAAAAGRMQADGRLRAVGRKNPSERVGRHEGRLIHFAQRLGKHVVSQAVPHGRRTPS